MNLTLPQFFLLLNEYIDQVPLHVLKVYLQQLKITLDDIKDYVQFSPDRYRRNLLHDESGYQALVICWKSGQRSPIHNHKGSSCGVRILKGVATETLFATAPNNLVYPTNSEWLYEGEVTGSEDDDVHQVSNLQDEDHDLVTLHIYSPPLLHMNCYSLESNEVKAFSDPIHSLRDGDGI